MSQALLCGFKRRMSDRPKTPSVLPTPLPEEQTKGGGDERRKQARYSFTATADVYELRSQLHVNGRCSDLSSGGCYIDTLSPLAVGAVVSMRIMREKRACEVSAIVTYSHPSMGMGLAFTRMSGEDQDVLRSWIAELGGEPPPESVDQAMKPGPVTIEKGADVQLILCELITILMRKNIITDKEGATLLRRMFR
jgi:hypothetical protein